MTQPMTLRLPSIDVPPYRLSGVVYSALLNHAPQLAALGDAVHQPPYKAPPTHPVLALRPRHTLAGPGDALVVPAGFEALQTGASLGIVIARPACCVAVAQALDFVAGYLIVNDVQLPLSSHYRPAVRFKARDGFCPLGALVLPAAQVAQPDSLAVRVLIDGVLQQATSTAGRLRGVAQLLADVTEFMSLQPGDVLTLGIAHGAPLARAGQTVTIQIDGLGQLSNPVRAQEALA